MGILYFISGVVVGVVVEYFFSKKDTGSPDLNSIILKLDNIMAKSQERFDLLMGRLDKVSTDIAADYAQLLKAIADGADSVSEESFAKHEANIAILEQLGASVENPVPVPPEEPPVEPV